MHDINAIRQGLVDFTNALARRGVEDAAREPVLAYAAQRGLSEELEKRRAEQKRASERFVQLTRRGELLNRESQALHKEYQDQPGRAGIVEDFNQNTADLKQASEDLEAHISVSQATRSIMPFLEEAYDKARAQYEQSLSILPNLPAPDVPDGLDETGNVVVHTRGSPPAFDFPPREHDTLALRFGYDPDAAAAIAGARFAVLTGPLARLHRALGQFMLDANIAAGWTEVAPPVLVQPRAMFGTGQLPKFADDAFQTTDGRYLIPTAEVSLTNLIRGKVLDREALPLRFTALTPCFRQEAGSAGRDTRGLIRQHQFDKVELVSIVADADAAAQEHERMTAQAESLLDALGLPYRRMLLCAGDMGFTARKTFDLEVWLPGQGQYREISSVSDCGDFQARRMDVDEPKGGRFRTKSVKGTSFVHTLNGSALAVGRCLVAVLENYQRADGSVRIPDALAGYMGDTTQLTPT